MDGRDLNYGNRSFLFYHTSATASEVSDWWSKSLRRENQPIICSENQDQPNSGLQGRSFPSKKTPLSPSSSGNPASGEATCLACHRPSRKDVGTAAYWQRVRSLSRDNKKRMDARETQWRMAELEEAKRRKEILSQRRREKEELTERYMRKPLYAVRSSSVGAPEHKRGSSITTTRSVPDLEEAFRTIQREQLARARSQTLTSSSCETWSTTREKLSPPIYRKYCHPPGANQPTNFSPIKKNNRGRIIRENQKAYPTRSIEELKERHSLNTSNKHIPCSIISRRRTYPRECTNRASTPFDAASLPEASVIVFQRPKVIRRGSMPDLTKCKCISSTMVYESVSALDNSLDPHDVIVLQKNKLNPSLYGASRTQKVRTLNYLSESLNNKSTGTIDQSISEQESKKKAYGSCTLSSKTYRTSLQMSRRKEWTAEQLSKNELKRKVLSSESSKTLPAKASHDLKSAVKKLAVSSVSSEGNESSFYDSLEEDNPTGKSKPKKKSFFVPLEENGSCNLPSTNMTLPQRLSSRIKLLENVLQRPRTASNTSSRLNLRGKKIHPLQIEALLLSEGYVYTEIEDLDKKQFKKSQSIESLKNALANEELEKLPELSSNRKNSLDPVRDHLDFNNLKFRPTKPVEKVTLNFHGLNKSETNQSNIINLNSSESFFASKTSTFVSKQSIENKTNVPYSNFSDPSSVNIKVNSNSKIPIRKVMSSDVSKGFEFNKTFDALHPEDENIDTSNLSSLSSDVSLSGMVDTNETFSLDTVSDCHSLTEITVNENRCLQSDEKTNKSRENEMAFTDADDYAYKFTKTKDCKAESSPNEANVKAIEGFAGNGREALLESGFGDDESCGSDPDNSTETLNSDKTKSDTQRETCDLKSPKRREGDSVFEEITTSSSVKIYHVKTNTWSRNEGNTSRLTEGTQLSFEDNKSNSRLGPIEYVLISSEEEPSETNKENNPKYQRTFDIPQQEIEIVHIGTIEDELQSTVGHSHEELGAVSGTRSCSENETNDNSTTDVFTREHRLEHKIGVGNKDQGVLNTVLQAENENTDQNIESESSKATEFDLKDISPSEENEATHGSSSRTVSKGEVVIHSSVKHPTDENEMNILTENDASNSSGDDEIGENKKEISTNNNESKTYSILNEEIQDCLPVAQNIGIFSDSFPQEESEEKRVAESMSLKTPENIPSKLCREGNMSHYFNKTNNEADFESQADPNDISHLGNEMEDISETLSSIENVKTCEGEHEENQCNNCERKEEKMTEGKSENASDTLFQLELKEEYETKSLRCPCNHVDYESQVSIESGVKQESEVIDQISGDVKIQEAKSESESHEAISQDTSDDISTNIDEIAESSNVTSKQNSFNLSQQFEIDQDESASLEETRSISHTGDNTNAESDPTKQYECTKQSDISAIIDLDQNVHPTSFETKHDKHVEDGHHERCENALLVNISREENAYFPPHYSGRKDIVVKYNETLRENLLEIGNDPKRTVSENKNKNISKDHTSQDEMGQINIMTGITEKERVSEVFVGENGKDIKKDPEPLLLLDEHKVKTTKESEATAERETRPIARGKIDSYIVKQNPWANNEENGHNAGEEVWSTIAAKKEQDTTENINLCSEEDNDSDTPEKIEPCGSKSADTIINEKVKLSGDVGMKLCTEEEIEQDADEETVASSSQDKKSESIKLKCGVAKLELAFPNKNKSYTVEDEMARKVESATIKEINYSTPNKSETSDSDGATVSNITEINDSAILRNSMTITAKKCQCGTTDEFEIYVAKEGEFCYETEIDPIGHHENKPEVANKIEPEDDKNVLKEVEPETTERNSNYLEEIECEAENIDMFVNEEDQPYGSEVIQSVAADETGDNIVSECYTGPVRENFSYTDEEIEFEAPEQIVSNTATEPYSDQIRTNSDSGTELNHKFGPDITKTETSISKEIDLDATTTRKLKTTKENESCTVEETKLEEAREFEPDPASATKLHSNEEIKQDTSETSKKNNSKDNNPEAVNLIKPNDPPRTYEPSAPRNTGEEMKLEVTGNKLNAHKGLKQDIYTNNEPISNKFTEPCVTGTIEPSIAEDTEPYDAELENYNVKKIEFGNTECNEPSYIKRIEPTDGIKTEAGDAKTVELDDGNDIDPEHAKIIEHRDAEEIELRDAEEIETSDNEEFEVDDVEAIKPTDAERIESNDNETIETQDAEEIEHDHNEKGENHYVEENEVAIVEKLKPDHAEENELVHTDKIEIINSEEIETEDHEQKETGDTGEIKVQNVGKIKHHHAKDSESDAEKSVSDDAEKTELDYVSDTEPCHAKTLESEDVEQKKFDYIRENKFESAEKIIPDYSEEIESEDGEKNKKYAAEDAKIDIAYDIEPYHAKMMESENAEAKVLDDIGENKVENAEKIILDHAEEMESEDAEKNKTDDAEKAELGEEYNIEPYHAKTMESENAGLKKLDDTGENKVENDGKIIPDHVEGIESKSTKKNETDDAELDEDYGSQLSRATKMEFENVEAKEFDIGENKVENAEKIIPDHAEKIESENAEKNKTDDAEEAELDEEYNIEPYHAKAMESVNAGLKELDDTEENIVENDGKIIPDHVEEIESKSTEKNKTDDVELDEDYGIELCHAKKMEFENVEAKELDTGKIKVENAEKIIPKHAEEIKSEDAEKNKTDDAALDEEYDIETYHAKIIESENSEAKELDTEENKVETAEKIIPDHAEEIESVDAEKNKTNDAEEAELDEEYDIETYHAKTMKSKNSEAKELDTEENKVENGEKIIPDLAKEIKSEEDEKNETGDAEEAELSAANDIEPSHAKTIESKDSEEIKPKNVQSEPDVNIELEVPREIASCALQASVSTISEDNGGNIERKNESFISENFNFLSSSNNIIYLTEKNGTGLSENYKPATALMNESLTPTENVCSVGLQSEFSVEEWEQSEPVEGNTTDVVGEYECIESDIDYSGKLIPETKKIFEGTIREQEDSNLDRIDSMTSLSFNIGEDGSESSLSSDRITVIRNLVDSSRNSYTANSTCAISDIDVDHVSDICSNVDENQLSDYNEDQVNTLEKAKTDERSNNGSESQNNRCHSINENLNVSLSRTLYRKLQKSISLGKYKNESEGIQKELSDDCNFERGISRDESEDLYSEGDVDDFSNPYDIIMNEEDLVKLTHDEISSTDFLSEIFTTVVQGNPGTSQSIDSNSDLSTIEEENEHSSDTLDDQRINVISQLEEKNIRANNRALFSQDRSDCKDLGFSLTQKEFERIRNLSLESQNVQSLESKDVINFQEQTDKWNKNVSEAFISKPINNKGFTENIFLETECHRSNQHIGLAGEVDNNQSCSEEITFSSDITKDETAHPSINSLKVDYEEDLSKDSSLNNSALELEIDEAYHAEPALSASSDNDCRAINNTKLVLKHNESCGPNESKIESSGCESERVLQENGLTLFSVQKKVMKGGEPTQETSFVLSDYSTDLQNSLNFQMFSDTKINFAVDSLMNKHFKKTNICNSSNKYQPYLTKTKLKEKISHSFEVDSDRKEPRSDFTQRSNSLTSFSISTQQNEDGKNSRADITPLNKTNNYLTKGNYHEKNLNCGLQSLDNSHYNHRHISYDEGNPILSSKSPSSDSGVMELAGPSKKSNKARPPLIREGRDDSASPELLLEPQTHITSREQKDKSLLNQIISGPFQREDFESMNHSGDSHSETDLYGELPNTPLCTDSEGSLQCRNQCIHDYDESMNNETTSPSEKHCAQDQLHMSPNDQQTDVPDSSDDEADVHSDYTLRLLRAFEKRRRRRRRHRPPNIDVDDFSRKDYRPPLLSNFDAFLASLSNYRSKDGLHRDQDEEHRTDNRKEVTVEVSSGKESHDIRVKAEDKIRLLVEVTPSRSKKKFRISPEENSKMSLPSEVLSHRKGKYTRFAQSETSSSEEWRSPRFNNYVGVDLELGEKKYLRRRSSVNSEDGECDLSVEGNNIEKCFTAPSPGSHRHLLNVQNRVAPIVTGKKEKREHDPNTKEQRRIQRSIKAIKELLKTLT